ncbi:MAG: hypothetical protein ABIJ34_08475 [archaeon]
MRLQSYFKDPTVKNGFFLLMGSAINSIGGFIFFLLVARLYASTDVGSSSVLISALGIITTLAMFGLDETLIKYHHKDGEAIIGLAAAVTSIVAFISSVIILAIILKSDASELSAIHMVIFILSAVSWTFSTLLDVIYIAKKQSVHVFYKSIIQNVIKLILPCLLVAQGYFGIFLAWGISSFLASIIMLYFTKISLNMNFSLLQKYFGFSSMNYISNVIFWARDFLVPLILATLKGALFTAQYFIPNRFLVLFYIAPKAITRAFFAEISGKKRSSFTIVTLITLGFSVVFLLGVIFFGRWILGVYGEDYAFAGYDLFVLFAFTGIFSSFNEIVLTKERYRGSGLPILLIKGAPAILTLVTLPFTIGFGLIGIGYSYLIPEMIISIYAAMRFAK